MADDNPLRADPASGALGPLERSASEPPRTQISVVDAIQWAPSGNPLSGIPGQITRFLSVGGLQFGYGYGPGWSVGFGYQNSTGGRSDVFVNPGQWVVRWSDGSVTAEDADPRVGVAHDGGTGRG